MISTGALPLDTGDLGESIIAGLEISLGVPDAGGTAGGRSRGLAVLPVRTVVIGVLVAEDNWVGCKTMLLDGMGYETSTVDLGGSVFCDGFQFIWEISLSSSC
ncbi:MAG: hypothetical protein ACO1N5_07275 [Noviherbaspirillum sp.]